MQRRSVYITSVCCGSKPLRVQPLPNLSSCWHTTAMKRERDGALYGNSGTTASVSTSGHAPAPPAYVPKTWRLPEAAAAQLASARARAGSGALPEIGGSYLGVIVSVRRLSPSPDGGLALTLGLASCQSGVEAASAVIFIDTGVGWERARAGAARVGDVLLAPQVVVQEGPGADAQLKVSRKKFVLVLAAEWLTLPLKCASTAEAAPPLPAAAIAAITAVLTFHATRVNARQAANALAEAEFALKAASQARQAWLERAAGSSATGNPTSAPLLPLATKPGSHREAGIALVRLLASVPPDAPPTHFVYALLDGLQQTAEFHGTSAGGAAHGAAPPLGVLHLSATAPPRLHETLRRLAGELAAAGGVRGPGVWALLRNVRVVSVADVGNSGVAAAEAAAAAAGGLLAAPTLLFAMDKMGLLPLPAGAWPASLLPLQPLPQPLLPPLPLPPTLQEPPDISDEALAALEFDENPSPAAPAPPTAAAPGPLRPLSTQAAVTEVTEAGMAVACLRSALSPLPVTPLSAFARELAASPGLCSSEATSTLSPQPQTPPPTLRRVLLRPLGRLPADERGCLRFGTGAGGVQSPVIHLLLAVACAAAGGDSGARATLVIEGEEADELFAGTGATASALSAPDAAPVVWSAFRRALRTLIAATAIIDCLAFPLAVLPGPSPVFAGGGGGGAAAHIILKLVGTRMRVGL